MAKKENREEVAFIPRTDLNEKDRSLLEEILKQDQSLLSEEQRGTLRAREAYLNDAERGRFSNVLRETPLATDDAETKAKKSQGGIDRGDE